MSLCTKNEGKLCRIDSFIHRAEALTPETQQQELFMRLLAVGLIYNGEYV